MPEVRSPSVLFDSAGDPVRIPLRRWRGQWAHLPLSFVPLALAIPLLLVSAWLDGLGYATVSQAVGLLGGLGFMAGVLAMPWAFARWRQRGSLVLSVGATRVALETVDGRLLAEVPRAAGLARFGAFEYHVTHRYAGGWYRAPRVDLDLPGGPLGVGGEGVRAPAESRAPRVPPAYLVTADDWRRLEEALASDGLPGPERGSTGRPAQRVGEGATTQ